MVEGEVATNGDAGAELPAEVEIVGAPRFSANQMRRIAVESGRSVADAMADPAAIMQAAVFFELIRRGYHPTWEQAGDIPIGYGEEPADPTSPVIATGSPPSVATGA